jgi:hypothetical protein
MVALRALEEKFRRVKDAIGAPARFNLPRDTGPGIGLREKLDAQFGRPRRWCRTRFARSTTIVSTIITSIALPRPAPRSAAFTSRTSTARTRPPPITLRRTRTATLALSTAIVARRAPITTIAATPFAAISRVALIVRVAILLRGFFQPVGEKFQIEFLRGVAHRDVLGNPAPSSMREPICGIVCAGK